jgi:hypothetical protein
MDRFEALFLPHTDADTMKKPKINHFPNLLGVEYAPGDCVCRTHHCGSYDLPVGLAITDTRLANFSCRECGKPIRWKQFANGSTVLSCFCFSVVLGPPVKRLAINEQLWADWIAGYLLQEELERLHAN